jgi:multidrug efflux pump subunit AcrA (membrane-fusion protein)
MAHAAEPRPERQTRQAPASPRGPILAGLLVIALAFGGFGSWAAFSPLNSAGIAPVKVAVEGEHKTVQHLEGGIVETILVHEGQHVAAGEVPVRLEAQRRAQHRRLALLEDEIARLARLASQGHAGKPRLLELQREAAEFGALLADAHTEPFTDISYYLARIDRDQLAGLDGIELYPGMPA